MSNRSAGTGIRCPIDLFGAHEARIETLTAAINAAPTASDCALRGRGARPTPI